MSVGPQRLLREHKRPYLFNEFFTHGKDESASPFLTPTSRRFAQNLFLKVSIVSAISLILSFVFSFFPALRPFSNICLIAVYFFSGVPALIEAIEDILSFEINIDVLMVVAAFLSVLIDSAFEGGLLLVLFAISGAMEEAVLGKATSVINNLKELSPEQAWVMGGQGHLIPRSLKDIRVGQEIFVKTGEMVPLDGVIIEGRASLHMSHLTGEQLPQTKEVGEEVVAGAHMIDGNLKLRVTKTSADSTLARIVQLIKEAQSQRPKLQRWFDRFSRGYAITIMALALIFALSLPYLFSIGYLGIEGSIYRALTFLIAASPCALIIAVPIAYLSSISSCAKYGVLLKGGFTLDALSSVASVAFDKTGTVTTGELKLVALEPLDANSTFTEKEAIAMAYGLEQHVTHPIAKAIVAFAESNNYQSLRVDDIHNIPGRGIQGKAHLGASSFEILMGNWQLLEDRIPVEKMENLKKQLENIETSGLLSCVLFAREEVFIFSFQDEVKLQAADVLNDLRNKLNMKTLMLTGDRRVTASKIGDLLGFDYIYGELKPEDKLQLVKDYSQQGGLLMVGDGINDAPALARATVGISMGKLGSTTAVDASDAILLNDDLQGIPWVLKKAKKTQGIILENVILAALVIVCISIPAIFGFIPLWLAVILHEGGTVLVGLNSLRLLRR